MTPPVMPPIKCPSGNHPIFVREDGSIVAHYDGDGRRCKSSEQKFMEQDKQ